MRLPDEKYCHILHSIYPNQTRIEYLYFHQGLEIQIRKKGK